MSINSVVIVGNLTRDPEVRAVADTSVCTLGVAVNERTKTGGEWGERANFFDVEVWGAQADACSRYLTKGRQVAVSGRLRWESWEKDGQKRSKVLIRANEVQFIGSRETTMDEARDMAKAAGLLKGAAVDEDDDIPFDERGR